MRYECEIGREVDDHSSDLMRYLDFICFVYMQSNWLLRRAALRFDWMNDFAAASNCSLTAVALKLFH